MKNIHIGSTLQSVLTDIKQARGFGLLVGGCVRDALLGTEPKDIDIEVHNICADKLTSILSNYGQVDAVGKSFGVLKLRSQDGIWYDFSLPRRESKQGRGHRGFLVEVDPFMTIEDAAARRDFTINSMAYDPLGDVLYDFFNGQEHLRKKILVPTSEAFKDDPLRVLRGMQFAARYDMVCSPLLIRYAEEMKEEYKDLAVERVWGEWEKLCSKGVSPSAGLELLEQTGWIDHYPELKALIGVKQDDVWHPEGSAEVHTRYVADSAADIAHREKLNHEERVILILAAICHDLGKASTTVFKNGRWRAPGHDVEGVPLAESFLKSIGAPPYIIERVKPLVRWHMTHIRNKITKRSVRKLSLAMQPSNIAELALLIEADYSGRPPLPKGLPPKALELKEMASEIGVVRSKLAPILMGRHLIEKGLSPGVHFGPILAEAFALQVDGAINCEAEAKTWLDSKLACL